MTKVCSKCGKEKPATTECFGKAKRNKDGLTGQCKDCIKEYKKQWRQENKEEIKERKSQWYKKNKEERKKRRKQYYKENKEKMKEYHKQYHKENKEKLKEHKKQYYKENKEEIKERHKQYYKENKEAIKECQSQWRKENKEYQKQYFKQYRQENKESRRRHSQTYQARKRLLPATLTLDQWQQIKDDFNNECAYCGKSEQEHKEEFNEQLHQEHFIPLSKGGGYTQNNIIPACKSCNCSKNNTDFFEWYPTYEYYNEEREQFILEYLGYIDDNQQLTFDIEVI